ncbi:hypothetical protein [Streptomyces sp. H39-S7]|uniref:hypothetical protein n=1 Tax=Streptomyces sp. H39-S7 TaxID=3004357 RepID=UPI0022AF66E1|nr:hypothetical protein [Streptomyces sp. H39-S7]MCZ4120469.1 hypothetical protein [Streptomyces sp. H39-S7]
MASHERSARLLVGLLAGGAAAHVLLPKAFDATIPRALPGTPRTWTYGSAVVELAVAGAVAVPATRRVGALLAAGLLTAVFPANVKMAYDWRHRPAPLRTAALVRLPVQVPLVLWALRVSRQQTPRRQG